MIAYFLRKLDHIYRRRSGLLCFRIVWVSRSWCFFSKAMTDGCHFAEKFAARQDALDDASDEKGTVRSVNRRSLGADTCELVRDGVFVYYPIFAVISIVLFNFITCSAEQAFPDLLVDEVEHVDDSNLALAGSGDIELFVELASEHQFKDTFTDGHAKLEQLLL